MDRPVQDIRAPSPFEASPFSITAQSLDTATSGSMALQALDAQAALLPYALILFGVGLPIFAWACSFAADRLWMTASFVIFACNWGAFYAITGAYRQSPALMTRVGARMRIHVLGGLLWAAAIAQITALGLGAGAARDGIELLAVGGAAACIFFSSPCLPTLLIVGPAAAAPPILALCFSPGGGALGRLALGGVALVLALSLIFNRMLRRQFALAAERESLTADRARSLSRAEALAQSKSDLIATLSHEIRNGLTGVAHVLAAAAAGGRSGPSREQMSAALTAARDLIEALNATLDTESAEAGRLSIETCAFDPAQLLQDILVVQRPLAAAKGLELGLHVDETLALGGAAIGDPARARQILSNLVANAVKYTVRGRVEVRAERLGEQRLRFEIADTGPGLTPEEIEEAFQPFKRIARTGAGVSGAGLGLSLSRRLARLMRGDVTVESALSVGSCFRFDLPFDPAAALAAPRPVAYEPALPPLAGGARALRILTADDNALGVAMLRATLEQLGHQVLHAHDGRRAVELAQTCDLDVLIMSARLPDQDGPEVVRAVRGLAGPVRDLAIITLIDGDAEEAQASLAAGANAILRRPVTVSSVARALAAAQRDDGAPPLRRAAG